MDDKIDREFEQQAISTFTVSYLKPNQIECEFVFVSKFCLLKR